MIMKINWRLIVASCLVCLLSSGKAFGQDVIVKRDGSTIVSKVTEVKIRIQTSVPL